MQQNDDENPDYAELNENEQQREPNSQEVQLFDISAQPNLLLHLRGKPNQEWFGQSVLDSSGNRCSDAARALGVEVDFAFVFGDIRDCASQWQRTGSVKRRKGVRVARPSACCGGIFPPWLGARPALAGALMQEGAAMDRVYTLKFRGSALN